MRPTIAPSQSPSALPSYPLSNDEAVTYVVVQIVHGLNVLEYYDNRTLYNIVLFDAVASVMSGVNPADMDAFNLGAVFSSESTRVFYSITIPHTSVVGYLTGLEAYNITASALQRALANGNFTSVYQSKARAYHVAALYNASSETATFTLGSVTDNSPPAGVPGVNIGISFNIILLVCITGTLLLSGFIYWIVHKAGIMNGDGERKTEI